MRQDRLFDVAPALALATAMVILAGPVWGSDGPVVSSPGSATGTRIDSQCPTFSWGGLPRAESHELVVYLLGEETNDARPVLRELLPGQVSSWTPPLKRCLEQGGRYAWSVRAVGAELASDWSRPNLFEIARQPSWRPAETLVGTASAVDSGLSEDATDRPAAEAGEDQANGSGAQPSLPAPGPRAVGVTEFTVDGGVEAVSFTGDGSTLTSLDPANLQSGTAAIDISGTASGISGTLPIASGGTGATTSSSARTNLGAAQSGTNTDITSLSALTTPLSLSQGGSGATSAAAARASLGAAASGSNSDITSLFGLSTPLSVAQGGTGGGDATAARSNLDAAAGTHTHTESEITDLSADGHSLDAADGSPVDVVAVDSAGNITATGELDLTGDLDLVGDLMVGTPSQSQVARFYTSGSALKLLKVGGFEFGELETNADNDFVIRPSNGKLRTQSDLYLQFGTGTSWKSLLAGNVEVRDELLFKEADGTERGSFIRSGNDIAFFDGTGDGHLQIRDRLHVTGDSEAYLTFGTSNSERIWFKEGPSSTTDLNLQMGSVQNGELRVLGSLRVDQDTNLYGNLIMHGVPTGSQTGTLCYQDTVFGDYIIKCSSSLRFKTNVAPFSSGLELVRQLRPVSYEWKENGQSDLGLIAEEVALVHPLLATYEEAEIQGVKYDRLTVLLINAIKEQQVQIERLRALVCADRPHASACETR